MDSKRKGKQTLIRLCVLAISIAVAPAATAADHVQCKKVGGSIVVTATSDGSVYAINGSARTMAAAQGWKDGKERYEPSELLTLLQQGVKSCSSTGSTSTAVPELSIHSAKVDSSPAPVEALGAKTSSSFSREGFSKAASNGDIPTLKEYVDGGYAVDTSGPDMPWLNQKGNPVIAAAAAAKKCAAVDYLLSAGAKPDFMGIKYGWTPIAHAAQAGATDCVRSLLAAGARPDVALERGGDTPLIMAAYQGHFDVVKLLVEHGASLSTKNNDGDTAYRAAVVGGSNATAQYLKSKGGK